ncbi:MAG TPA: hypothetical protein VE526_05235 [Solirubrobacteraceae bacterium]|nr:hypothetical protein [Solirubrobacteraceae bacterium]
MRARLIPALLAAFALLAAPAPAQDPSPPPTGSPSPAPSPSPEPAPERSDEVKAIYRDYQRDGEINGCKHEKADLKEARKGLTDTDDAEYPDLRYQLEAAIDQHKSGDCAEEAAEEQDDDTDTGTGSTGSGTTGGGTTGGTPTPAPAAPVTPGPTVSPPTGAGSGSQGPLDAGDLSPVTPEVTPVPPAGAPPSTTIPPAEAATPAPTPAPVYSNPDDGVPVALVVLAGLLGALALAALVLALVSRAGWGERALAGPQRAWREAAFRAGGTWGDFADWIRVGR